MSSGWAGESRWLRAAVALGLAALAIAVHLSVADHQLLIYDDDVLLSPTLPGLTAGLGAKGIDWALRSTEAGNWMPLTRLSWLLDVSLFGFGAKPFLVGNVLYHGLATVLLFAALCTLTRATERSALVAAIFAVHPLHVESIAWASERKDVVCGAFWMGTLLAYAFFVQRKSVPRSMLVFACLALALLAKPNAVSLPFVLLLLDVWPLGRVRTDGLGFALSTLRRPVVEKLPLLILAVAASAVTVYSQRESGSIQGFALFPLGARLANAALAPFWYLYKFVWPTGLAVFYPHPGDSVSYAAAWIAGASLLLLTALAMLAVRRWPYVTVGWLWFLGTLVPVIGIVQVGYQAVADRYMYVPLVGLALMLVWGAADVAARARLGTLVQRAASAALVGALAVGSVGQLHHWQDNDTLFGHALAVTQANWLAHDRLAVTAEGRGAYPSAAAHLEELIRLAPDNPLAQMNYGRVLLHLGRKEEALAAIQKSLALQPDLDESARAAIAATLSAGLSADSATAAGARVEAGNAMWHAAHGDALKRLGRSGEAVAAYREALRLEHPWPELENNLAWILATDPDPAVRNPTEAVRLAEAAVAELGRADAGSLDTLAVAYAVAERRTDALNTAREALVQAQAAGDPDSIASIASHVRRLEAMARTDAE